MYEHIYAKVILDVWNTKRFKKARNNVVLQNANNNFSCWTAGVTSCSNPSGQILPGIGFMVTFYEGDTSPFFL